MTSLDMAFRQESPKKKAASKSSSRKAKDTSGAARVVPLAQQNSLQSALKRPRKQDEWQEFAESDEDYPGDDREPAPEPRKRSKRVSNAADASDVPNREDDDTPGHECFAALRKMVDKVGYFECKMLTAAQARGSHP